MGSSQIARNKRKINFFTFYRGLSYDYLFLYAIDSIYFHEVMGMSFSQISLITTVFALVYMIVQIPLVKVIEKIGTANASKIGTFIMAASNIFLFFQPWMVFLSYGLAAIGFGMKTLSEPKILKDNLKMYGLSDGFSKYTSFSKALYSIFYAISCFASGFLYQVWAYAPIVVCTVIMFISAILSLFIKNEKELYRKDSDLPGGQKMPAERHEFFKLLKYRTTWMLLFFSALFSALVCCGMDICKPTFQEVGFSPISITIAIGVVVVFRSLIGLCFGYIYNKFKYSSIYIVLGMVTIGLIMMGLGGLFLTGTTALIILSIGGVLIFSSRDPFDLIREDFVMNSRGLTKRQALLSLTNVGAYGGRFLTSLAISAILLSQPTSTMNLILAGVFVPLSLTLSLLLGRKRKMNKY